MAREAQDSLSADGAVAVTNASGRGAFVLVCEHAANFIPPELGDLGLDPEALKSHVAWDPGALAVARGLSAALDSPLVTPRVSRLVYDCNRPPESPSAVPAKSESYVIPGNAGLSDEARQARAEAYYFPFREALGACIETRLDRRIEPVLLTVHSFTPVYEGIAREVEIGVLHDADSRFADALIPAFQAETPFTVRRNQPYGPQDGVTHTLVTQALSRGLLNAMIEIRQDLIPDRARQEAMAERLRACALKALGAFTRTPRDGAQAAGGH